MKKLATILLGIATLWPLVDTIIFTFLWFSMMFAMFGGSSTADPSPVLDLVMKFQTFTALFSIPLLLFYYFHLYRNQQIAKDRKVLWAVILFFGIPFTMPIYWYLYLWRGLP